MGRHESTPNDTPRRWAKALGAGAVTAGTLDAAWIGGAALKLYEAKIPHLSCTRRRSRTCSATP